MSDYLDNIEQRANAATEGPWEAGVDDWNGYYVRTPWKFGFGVAYVASLIQQGEDGGEADAEFIAAARTALPKLVAALKAVLALHHGGDHAECAYQEPDWRRQRCHHCGDLWPCLTVCTITEALGIEEVDHE